MVRRADACRFGSLAYRLSPIASRLSKRDRRRGSNENTNGLLRQYFPRATDLSRFSQEYLNRIALRLNQRPRKTLGFALLPIDYKPCCIDRLNPPPKADIGLLTRTDR